jgi:hypothetical protein
MMAIHYQELDQEGPTPAQERDHLAEQCAALLRENEQLRAHLLNLYEDCRGGRASNQSMRKARQMLGLNQQSAQEKLNV